MVSFLGCFYQLPEKPAEMERARANVGDASLADTGFMAIATLILTQGMVSAVIKGEEDGNTKNPLTPGGVV